MTELRQAVREAIRIVRESDMRWVLTQKGRAALRTAYYQGLDGVPLPVRDVLTLPLVVAYFIGVEERWQREPQGGQTGGRRTR